MDLGLLSTYLPLDRRQAMAMGKTLPDRMTGTALFADISGFTPLTHAFLTALGPKHGPEELTRRLNQVYDGLIKQTHLFKGSVIGFSGDALTCWFDNASTPPAAWRATACGLAMQRLMQERFAAMPVAPGSSISLALKVAVASGPARRFRVGDPQIQYLDVLAGQTLARMAAAEQQTGPGEVMVDAETLPYLGRVATHPPRAGPNQRFAVVTALADSAPISSPQLATPALSQALPSLPESDLRPWLLPPVYERLRSGQDQFLAEIRPAVPLFVRFEGLAYDQDEAAGEKLDAFIRLVQNILAAYEGVLLQLTMGDKGSYLYAVFGAPLAHDDDPQRAVAAALELQALPSQVGFIQPMQVGISRGQMRVGAYGGPTRRTYGVLGDEVNTAARLMNQAQPGQIVISQHMAEAVEKQVQAWLLGPVRLKGREKPLPIWEVAGERRTAPQRPITRYNRPLVGRGKELAHLDQWLETVRAGAGQVVRLEGVAGVGKSRLTAELIEHALNRQMQVAIGASQSTSQGVAYYPWRQIFRALFGLTDKPLSSTKALLTEVQRAKPGVQSVLWTPGSAATANQTETQISQVRNIIEQLNPGWLLRFPLLRDLLGLPIPDNETTAAFDPKLRQEALQTLAIELILGWAQRGPLLLLLEDIHWLDEASRGLTLALARVIAEQPLLLLLVQRPVEPPWLAELDQLAYTRTLALAELEAGGVIDLVTQQLQGPVSSLLLTLIYTRTQGNPFFTEELLNALRETGQVSRDAQGSWDLTEQAVTILRQRNSLARQGESWTLTSDRAPDTTDLGLPDTIYGTVLSRLDRLPEEHKLTLKVAGVIGQSFEIELLRQAHPHRPDPADLIGQLEAMTARDLLRSEGRGYAFKHSLTQEVAYDTLLERQKQQLHRAVGHALEQQQPEAVERLAYHFRRSKKRDKSLLYLDRAARKTQQEYANETALAYYGYALELEERWQWHQGQIEILHLLGRREEEEAALRALAATPDAPEFEVAYLWGQYYEAVSEYEPAQAAIERALAASRQLEDLASEVHCLAQLGMVAYRHGDYERAKAWFDQALGSFQSDQSYGGELVKAYIEAFNGLGTIQEQQGQFEPARSAYEQGLSLSRASNDRQGEANILVGLGGTTFYQRHFAEARAYYEQALAIQRAIGDRAGEGTSLLRLGQVICDEGDYGWAEEDLRAAMKIVQATGNRWEEISILNSLGVVYHELGDLTRAQNCLENALQLVQEINAGEATASFSLINLGLVTRDQGNLQLAKKLFTQSLASVQAIDNKHLHSYLLSYLGTVNLQTGDLALAIEQAQSAIKLWTYLEMHLRTTHDLATLATAYLRTGNIFEASKFAEQTLQLLDECGGEGPEFPQRDYFVCYQVLAAAGMTRQAKAALENAYRLVINRVAKISNPKLRQSFRENVTINKEIITTYERYLCA